MRLPTVSEKSAQWAPVCGHPLGGGCIGTPWHLLPPTSRISKVPRVPQNQYGTSRWSRGISMVSRSAPKLAGGALVRA